MRKLKVSDLSEFDVNGIDHSDYPDFSDGYIYDARDKDGVELTDEELEWLNDNDSEGVYQVVYEYAMGI